MNAAGRTQEHQATERNGQAKKSLERHAVARIAHELSSRVVRNVITDAKAGNASDLRFF